MEKRILEYKVFENWHVSKGVGHLFLFASSTGKKARIFAFFQQVEVNVEQTFFERKLNEFEEKISKRLNCLLYKKRNNNLVFYYIC